MARIGVDAGDLVGAVDDVANPRLRGGLDLPSTGVPLVEAGQVPGAALPKSVTGGLPTVPC